jgi:hypothetical protein
MSDDQSSAPRQSATGYKGDAWSVTFPPDGPDPILLLDTGLDSVAIVRIPDGAWDRGSGPGTVHRHERYDETILIPLGSGTLYHGSDVEHIVMTRFDAPVTLVLPAGSWHHVAMDPGVAALGTAFYTVSGTVIEPFDVQMAVAIRDRVTYADLPIVEPVPVTATTWAGRLSASTTRASVVEALPSAGESTCRIIPVPPARDKDGLVMPLDTGRDSVFILGGYEVADPNAPPLVIPDILDVHRHPDVDEYVIRPGGTGFVVNGPTPASVTLTPFRGPCVLVMPAGALHRVIQIERAVGDAILIYADRHAVVERFERIVARTSTATIYDAIGKGAPG